MRSYFVGFDVGGTKTECALLEVSDQPTPHSHQLAVPGHPSRYLKVLTRERVPTERDKGYDFILKKMGSLWERMLPALPSAAAISGVGLGLPGTIDPKTYKMLNGNTNAFVGHDLRSDFEDIFLDVEKVVCANDANCFALAEVLCGVGFQYAKETGVAPENQSAVGIILGTDCGGGIVIDGKVIAGKNGGAGEMGHSLLVSEGRDCYCGRKGCAELYISGSGLEFSYSEISGRKMGTFAASDVFAWENKGEPEAKRAVMEYCAHLARFLANMTNVLDPDYFVLGGGVSLQPLIYQGLRETVEGDLFLPIDPPRVFQHSLGDSAGVIGAAILPLIL